MTPKTTTYSIQGKAGFQSNISGGACFACVVVRRFLLFLLLSALLTPLTTLFSACGHDDLVPPDVYVEETVPYVELRIAVPLANPSGTRANPMGGEEGNGRERGILNEDKIHDINVFFYIEEKDTDDQNNKTDDQNNKKGKGMNSENAILNKPFYYNLDNVNDPLNSKTYYPDPDKPEGYKGDYYEPYYEKGYVVIKLQCTDEDIKKIEGNGGINFVAVANAGPMQDTEGLKLSELMYRTLTYYNGTTWSSTNDAFSKNAVNMDYFLMSTAYNENYIFGGQSTGDNKIIKVGNEYKGTTTLQRMYARLDLWYNKDANAITEGEGNEEKVKELKYTVEKATGNTVYLTNVLPVNVMQNPSFLFKMVTNEVNSFDSDELSDVLTAKKYLWGGKESPSDIPVAGSANDKPLNYVIEPCTLLKNSIGGIKDGTQTLTDWYGNTAKSKVMGAYSASGNYESGDNAYSIRNTKIGGFSGYYHMLRTAGDYDGDYDCDHISIISYANENTHPTDCFHSNYLTGMAFRAVYVPAKIYKAYTRATDTEEGVLAAMTDGESVTNAKIYRYSRSNDGDASESNALYFISRTALADYEKDHLDDSAVVTEFDATIEPVSNKLGFVCYYNLWLRHYNNDSESNDPQDTYPMEYATVRNNIYRVAVSFSGPGDPEPTMREPDTMKARIFVRKWNYRKEDEIIF